MKHFKKFLTIFFSISLVIFTEMVQEKPKTNQNQLEIFSKFPGILLDAYGVFWGGNDTGSLPGSKELMEKLVLEGRVVGILSNSTQLASKEIQKLHNHGIIQGTHFQFLITSGQVARQIFLEENLPFKTPRKTYCLFGGAHPKFSSHQAIFQDTFYTEVTNIDDADFIYISIPHIHGEDQVDIELFREEIAKASSNNLPILCPNPDLFAHEGKPPRPVVRQGSIAKVFEELGGKVFYIGKPHPKAYEAAFAPFLQWGISNKEDILMVGDTPETDIRGARQFGMKTALTTDTGIMGDRVLHQGLEKALKDLPPTDTPHYLIERFSDAICPAPQS